VKVVASGAHMRTMKCYVIKLMFHRNYIYLYPKYILWDKKCN
jgi:hypothetical protein